VTEVPENAKTVPIGRPIANTEAYILDRTLQPVPVGVPGELYLGGDGLAREYLNSPDLTAERFIAHPFTDAPGARLYKTGDWARYLPDGNIEFLSRLDHQVKVRGFRIELGEIETALKAHPAVNDALVMVRTGETGGKRLVAYVVTEQKPGSGELRGYLQERLPSYMVPNAFVYLDAFPLTPNGKIDRRALPEPQEAESVKAFAPPETETERRLVAIWEELLGLKPVGIDDDFFALGGHSLLAMTLVNRVEAAFQVRLPLASLFRTSTVRQLAALLGGTQAPPASAPVIALQKHGIQPPFFCLPGIRGEVFSLRTFSELLGPAQPFYGLEFEDQEGSFDSLEALAAELVKHIRAIQPRGPYYLGGLCFGGVVAYEIARQLTVQGDQVAFLGLFEAYAPPPPLRWWASMKRRWRVIGSLSLMQNLEHVKKAIRHYKQVIVERSFMAVMPTRWMSRTLLKYQQREDRRKRAAIMGRYVPEPYAGNIHLFRAQADSAYIRALYGDTLSGWRPLCTGKIEVHTYHCGHAAMMRPPHIATVVDQVRRYLDQTRGNASSERGGGQHPEGA
jgi:thioesterase domain-containing protein/acyl carrier protein